VDASIETRDRQLLHSFSNAPRGDRGVTKVARRDYPHGVRSIARKHDIVPRLPTYIRCPGSIPSTFPGCQRSENLSDRSREIELRAEEKSRSSSSSNKLHDLSIAETGRDFPIFHAPSTRSRSLRGGQRFGTPCSLMDSTISRAETYFLPSHPRRRNAFGPFFLGTV